MMKIKLILCMLCIFNMQLNAQYIDANKNGKMDIYENPSADIEERITDLISQMNLDEKIAQVRSLANLQLDNQKGNNSVTTDIYKQIEHGLGQLSRSGETLVPEQTVKKLNQLQKYLLENTRLGIPAIIHEECLHGVMMEEATIFPQPIARASSWDVELEEAVASAIAQETRSRGSNLALTPNIDLARDPRYGRSDETFGEDPYLTSQMAIAIVNGFQGKDYMIGKDHIASTVKHFGASGQPVGGLNHASNFMNERTMRETDFVAFRAAIEKANVASVMAAYVEFDGISCHINPWLLTDVLRKEWGFNGIVVSDYNALNHVVELHHTSSNIEEAAKMAVEAGLDVYLPDVGAFKNLKKMVENGNIDMKYLSRSVRNVLRVKFRLGLFENRYADVLYAKKVNHSDEHKALALKSAQESIVLLKNDHNTLPIDLNKTRKIAVIGPNARQVHFGSYSTELSSKRGVSVYEGIKNYVRNKAELKYAEGCKIHQGDGYWRSPEAELNSKESDLALIKEAVELAKESDIIVLSIGGTPRICRENFDERIGDRHDLNLFGRQQLLVDEIIKTGKPVVIYLMNGRPLSILEIKEEASAILEGWYIGEETGTAVAHVLFGEVNPSGKLPISFPRSVGHIPCYYNKKPSALVNRYLLEKNKALFPFGYGLSYTTFKYSDLTLEKSEMGKDESTVARITIKNTGDYDGKEVVQMYIRDNISSVSRPVLELRGFKKIFLEKGESKTVEFDITPEKLRFFDRNMNEIVEPGEFTIHIGSSSVKLNSIKLNVIN
ncbi:MAG: glycoside hydrolase family 3 C-terminal domain-containing protein [Cyclobacteriaceae bacterium]